jgi:pimeloyl-ACP methyl ester carboxylesterase
MQHVTSKDGTQIAYDTFGTGPALVVVGGATATRADNVESAEILAQHFTVYSYDRRGRGDSGDTPPYAVEREVEDIEAVIDAAGGSAFLVGHSSGAVLALEAAARLPSKIKKLVVYEPPFIVDDNRPPLPKDYVAQLNAAIAAGRPEDAVEIFMTQAVRIPAEYMAGMREGPHWASSVAVAHTIAYDGLIMGDTMSGDPATLKKFAAVTVPTLVLDGGNSDPFMHNAAQTLTDILPNAQHRTLAGQDHGVAPDVLLQQLKEFCLT